MSTDGDSDTVDIAFELEGRNLGQDYSFALMREIARRIPWIEAEPEAGIHPLRAVKTDAGALLLVDAVTARQHPIQQDQMWRARLNKFPSLGHIVHGRDIPAPFFQGKAE